MKLKTKAIITASALTAFTCTYLGMSLTLINQAFKRKQTRTSNHLLLDYDKDYLNQLKLEQLEIEGYDHTKLKATLILSNQPSNKVMIGIHDYHSDAFNDFADFIRFYHDQNYHILLPDNRGHGESEGKYIGLGWLDRLDILDWIEKMKQYFHFQDIQIVLHGKSMGASAILMASGETLDSSVKCIISDSAYTNIIDEMKDILKQSKMPPHLFLPALKHLSKPIIGYDLHKVDAIKQVQKSSTPTLFIHDSSDEFIPVKMALSLYEACKSEKELLIMKDHSPIISKQAYMQKLNEFLSHYIK